MKSKTLNSIVQAAPVAGVLCFAAETKMGRPGIFWGGLDGLGDLAAAFIVFGLSIFFSSRLSAAVAFLLFLSFGLLHVFQLSNENYECGCFGQGKYSPALMSAGCLLSSFSQAIFIAGNPGRYRIAVHFGFILLGIGFFWSAKISERTTGTILNLCEFRGSSLPIDRWKEESSLSNPQSVLLLDRNCAKCRRWLTDKSVELGQFEQFSHLAVFDPDLSTFKPTVAGLIVPRHIVLDAPKWFNLDQSELIGECLSIDALAIGN